MGIPLNALQILHVRFAEASLQCLLESRILSHLRSQLVGTVALPCIAPTSVHASQVIGVRTADKDMRTLVQRQN